MIQFGSYPIYIVYSLHRQKAVEPIWNTSYGQMKSAHERALRDLRRLDIPRVARDLEVAAEKDRMIDAAIEWQIIEDIDPKYRGEIAEYESAIKKLLTKISHTSIGKMLLDLFSPRTKTWIIPANWKD